MDQGGCSQFVYSEGSPAGCTGAVNVSLEGSLCSTG